MSNEEVPPVLLLFVPGAVWVWAAGAPKETTQGAHQMIHGPKQRRYRVLWQDLAGDLYGHDRPTLQAAWREAMSLHKSTVPWQAIRIHDRKECVMWSLLPTKGAGDGT